MGEEVGGWGGGLAETTLLSSTDCNCAPALARGMEDVEGVSRQLELSESKVGRHFDWPVRGMLTLEISPVCQKPRISWIEICTSGRVCSKKKKKKNKKTCLGTPETVRLVLIFFS